MSLQYAATLCVEWQRRALRCAAAAAALALEHHAVIERSLAIDSASCYHGPENTCTPRAAPARPDIGSAQAFGTNGLELAQFCFDSDKYRYTGMSMLFVVLLLVLSGMHIRIR